MSVIMFIIITAENPDVSPDRVISVTQSKNRVSVGVTVLLKKKKKNPGLVTHVGAVS